MCLHLRTRSFQRGFTLIEVITVVVVLSILAALGGSFVAESTNSYQSTQTRSRLINTGRQAVERMTRQLRVSLPYSVRLTNGNMCLEFMPIASGGIYRGKLIVDPVTGQESYTEYVPDVVNGATTSPTIVVAPYTIDFGTAQFVSIGAMAASELYGANPASRATLSSVASTQLNLSASKVWQRNSVNKRFYLLTKPQAFCVVANQLRFYSDLDETSGAVDTSAAFSLLAENVTAATPFALTAGSENRNTVVQLNIAFTQNTESVTFNHAVMIRNVP